MESIFKGAVMSTTTKRQAPTSELYDLVLDMNWPRVEEHVAQNPQDASWFDWDSRETPLYLALQVGLPPASTVRALIKANPSSVMTPQTKNKNWPIHIVCRFGKQADKREMLDALFQSQKSVSGNSGDEYINSIKQQATARTKYGKTPLSALCDSTSLDGMTDLSLRPKHELKPHWECMQILLAAATGKYCPTWRLDDDTMELLLPPSNVDNHNDEERVSPSILSKAQKFLPFHVALHLSREHDCPLDVLRLAFRMLPKEHFSLTGDDGRFLLQTTLCNALEGTGFKNPKDCEWVVGKVLDQNRHAARVRDPKTSLLPLHSAVLVRPRYFNTKSSIQSTDLSVGRRMFEASGPVFNVRRLPWNGVLKDLFHAYPEAANVINPITGFLPFMDAATMEAEEMALKDEKSHGDSKQLNQNVSKFNHEKELDQILNNVYELLRVMPDVLLPWTSDGSKYCHDTSLKSR